MGGSGYASRMDTITNTNICPRLNMWHLTTCQSGEVRAHPSKLDYPRVQSPFLRMQCWEAQSQD